MLYLFSAKWCSSCLLTKQNLKKLLLKYKESGVDIEPVEIDVDDTSQKIETLKNKFQITDDSILPIFVDDTDKSTDSQIYFGEKNYSELITILDKHLKYLGKTSPSSNFNPKNNQFNSNFLSKLSNIFK
jgi:hypothetical protein